MGYAQQVIESISFNTSSGVLSWIGKKSGETSGSGSFNIKDVKVNNSGYADGAGNSDRLGGFDADTYAKKSDLKSSYTVDIPIAGISFGSVAISSGVNIITVGAIAGGVNNIPGNFTLLKDSATLNNNKGALCIYIGSRTVPVGRYYLTISASNFTATHAYPIRAQ